MKLANMWSDPEIYMFLYSPIPNTELHLKEKGTEKTSKQVNFAER